MHRSAWWAPPSEWPWLRRRASRAPPGRRCRRRPARGAWSAIRPPTSASRRSPARTVTVSLKQLHGKVVLVDFWGTFCDAVQELLPQAPGPQRQVRAARASRSSASARTRPRTRPRSPRSRAPTAPSSPSAWDEDRSISQRYQPETMPSSFLIDKRGIVRFAHVGYPRRRRGADREGDPGASGPLMDPARGDSVRTLERSERAD